MLDLIKELSLANGTSGRESAVRELIISKIEGFCQYSVDPLGNLIVFKKGAVTPKNKILLDAHMDEVGVMITHIGDNGLLSFGCVGGIDPKVILGRRFVFENGTVGVAGVTPIHLLKKDEERKIPSVDSLYIDIGASTREEAEGLVKVGMTGVFQSDFISLGENKIKGKALDDRVGCAILIELIRSELPYDVYISFSVQEEVGLRGAATAAFDVAPDYGVVLETTTAADIGDVPTHKQVCILGKGAAVSFMDRSTLYSRELYDAAFAVAGKRGIKIQPKTLVAGGNNAGAVHRAGAGVKTITVNVPCRYLHSPSCLCDVRDIQSARELTEALISEFANA